LRRPRAEFEEFFNFQSEHFVAGCTAMPDLIRIFETAGHWLSLFGKSVVPPTMIQEKMLGLPISA
jgi:hypothetical protein